MKPGHYGIEEIILILKNKQIERLLFDAKVIKINDRSVPRGCTFNSDLYYQCHCESVGLRRQTYGTRRAEVLTQISPAALSDWLTLTAHTHTHTPTVLHTCWNTACIILSPKETPSLLCIWKDRKSLDVPPLGWLICTIMSCRDMLSLQQRYAPPKHLVLPPKLPNRLIAPAGFIYKAP